MNLNIKKRIKGKNLIFGSIMFLGMDHALASDPVHLVKNGETLSGILYEKNLKPIYGKNGSIRLIQKLNPFLRKNKINKIYPGQTIILFKPDSKIDTPIENLTSLASSSSPQAESQESQQIDQVKKSSNSDLSFFLTSRFIKVESTDNKTNGRATLLSDSGSGYHFTWGQRWSDHLKTQIEFEKYQIHILNSSSTTSTLSNTNQNLTSYQFGAEYSISSQTRFISSLNYGESIVFRAESPTLLTIEKFNSAKLYNGFNYTLISKDELKLNSLVDFIIALPSAQETYSSKLSFGYKVGLALEDQISIFKLKGGLFYKTLNLKMNESNFQQSEVAMVIGLSKEFEDIK